MKDRTKQILYGLIPLVIVALIVGTLPSFQSCIGEQYHNETAQTLQQRRSHFLIIPKIGIFCLGEFVHRNGESIIAVFTIILGIATWLLWRSTKRLVEGAEDTARRQLRAYVCTVGCRMKRFEVGQEVVATVTVKNTGETPAYDTTVITAIEFRKLPVASNLILKKPTQLSRTTVGQDQIILPSAYSGKNLTSEEHLAISDGAAVIFVYGQVKYRTAFKDEQTTDFRFFFDNVSLSAADGTLRVATEGNEAT